MCCAGFDVDLGHGLCLFWCWVGHVLCWFPMQIALICADVHFISWSGLRSDHLDYKGTCINHCLAGVMFHGVSLFTFCFGCASPCRSRVLCFHQVLPSRRANCFWLGCRSMWCVHGLHTWHSCTESIVQCSADNDRARLNWGLHYLSVCEQWFSTLQVWYCHKIAFVSGIHPFVHVINQLWAQGIVS